MSTNFILLVEDLLLVATVAFNVWAALARDEESAKRRRRMVWSVAWVVWVAMAEVEHAMVHDCKCCELSVGEQMGFLAGVCTVTVLLVVAVGMLVYAPVRWVVRRRRAC